MSIRRASTEELKEGLGTRVKCTDSLLNYHQLSNDGADVSLGQGVSLPFVHENWRTAGEVLAFEKAVDFVNTSCWSEAFRLGPKSIVH